MKQHRQRPRKAKHKPAFDPAAIFRQPADSFYRIPELEIRAGRIITDGCKRILDYTPTRLCLDFGRTVTTFYGSGLKIELLAGKRLVVAGRVVRIDFADMREGSGDAL